MDPRRIIPYAIPNGLLVLRKLIEAVTEGSDFTNQYAIIMILNELPDQLFC
jgi:hypothetical protein